MKKIFYQGFVALVLVLCTAVLICTYAIGPSGPGANERLAAAPVLVDEEGGWNPDYLGDWAAWFADHFFGRQQLISANNWVGAHFFGTSGAEQVLLGEQGWLYYGDTLNDYTGAQPLSDRELFSIAANLALMEEYAERNGKAFLFVPAPNKNSLYPQFMPGFPKAETRDVQRLFALLDEMEVSYADLFAAFGEREEILYFAHDSHWNSRGAALGADVINAGFGVTTDYFGADFSRREPYGGDLYEMLYPAFSDPEENPVYGGSLNFTHSGSAAKPDSITLQTQGAGQGHLLAYRDSFGNLLYPYLAESYGSARFSRSTTYDLTLKGDYVLIELVERNLRYLITYIPVLESPVRDIPVPTQSAGTVTAAVTEGYAPKGFVQIRGTLSQAVDTDSKIYVICNGVAYEALLQSGGGFAVYVPEGASPQSVVYTQGGEYRLLSVQ